MPSYTSNSTSNSVGHFWAYLLGNVYILISCLAIKAEFQARRLLRTSKGRTLQKNQLSGFFPKAGGANLGTTHPAYWTIPNSIYGEVGAL